MCGITGFVSQTDHSEPLKNSLNLLHHRGPDGASNVALPLTESWYLGLGHARLRIMDTSTNADQPIHSADKDSYMVFNGEIYNFEELKNLLPNHRWRTQSDSEVVIELLNHFGRQALSYLNGMYAIAWYKKSTAELVLTRDPLGVKPLYLHFDGANICFASEVTALAPYGITPQVCKTDLIEFLSFGYVHEPRTGFSNISKIAPGQCLIWKDGHYQEETITDFAGPPAIAQNAHDLIKQAIEGQSDADVPVGTFFSGGVDSTVITAALNSPGMYVNAKGASEQNPELKRAKALSKELGVALDVINLDEDLTIDQFRKDVALIASKVEEPISDYTFIATKQIARLARQNGFVVMLSGMGGDEFFAGYPRYSLLNNLWFFRWVAVAVRIGLKLPGVNTVIARSKKIERLVSYFIEDNFVWSYARVVGYLTKSEIRELAAGDPDFYDHMTQISDRLEAITKNAQTADPLGQALALDQKGFLAHNLTVVDKSSMQESIEVRVPLLDLSIYTGFVKNMALRKQFPRVGKTVLKEFVDTVFGRHIDFGAKQGFNPPLDRIISKFDRESLSEMILTPRFKAYLNPAPVEAILGDHFSGKMNNTYKIWQLIFAASWLERWGTGATHES